jgi:hypothetical protein
MDEKVLSRANDEITNSTYIAPVITNPNPGFVTEEVKRELNALVEQDEDGETKLIAPKDVDQAEVAIKGSTVAVPNAAPQAIVSVQVVFDSAEQQRKWYDFVRWLRNDPAIDGNTTGERLINFIDAHTNA